MNLKVPNSADEVGNVASPWASFLILDDVPAHAVIGKERLITLFKEAGLEVDVTIKKHPNEVNSALESHPDFFICDVHLEGFGKAHGLQLIQNLKPKFPHINFVAMTINFEALEELGGVVVQPDFILSKVFFLSDQHPEFDKYLLGYFISNRRQNRSLRVSRDADVDGALKRLLGWQQFKPQLFDCLVRQVFRPFDLELDASQFWRQKQSKDAKRSNEKGLTDEMRPQDLDLGGIVDFVKVKKLDAQGRSVSAVFKAEPSYGDRKYGVTLILKFCPVKAFLKEVANFSRYVKWMLPYSWRVDILGEGISESVGVIAYSLAFAGSADAKPLSAYSTLANPKPIASFIGQVFSPSNRTWYEVVGVAEDETLARALWNRYFSDFGKLNRRLGDLKERLSDSDLFTQIYGRQYKMIDAFVGRVRDLTIGSPVLSRYETCICHGDLHCDNIMVGERRSGTKGAEEIGWAFAFIDFQDTGPAHIGTDFVVFENSIRKDSGFPLVMSELDYYRTEKQRISNILNGEKLPLPEEEKITSYFDLIDAVRAFFFANFPAANRQHYVFHLFVFTLFMIDEKFETLPRRDIMLAFFCAVVDALSEFREVNADGSENHIKPSA